MDTHFNYDLFLRRFSSLLDNDSRADYEIANKLGINRDVLSKYKKGINRVNLDTVAKIALLYGVSTDYLLGLTNASPAELSERETCESTGLTEKALECLRHLTWNRVEDSFSGGYRQIDPSDDFDISIEPIADHPLGRLTYYAVPSRKTVINELLGSEQFLSFIDLLRDFASMKTAESIHKQFRDIYPYSGSNTDAHEDLINDPIIEYHITRAAMNILDTLTSAYMAQHKNELDKALQEYTEQAKAKGLFLHIHDF